MNKYTVEYEVAIRKLLDVFVKQTPDEIAGDLRALGFKGRMRSPTGCPLAKFLRRNGYDGEVHRYVIKYNGAVIHMSKNIRGFVKEFDSGKYISLLE
jgi:hypothetical protein